MSARTKGMKLQPLQRNDPCENCPIRKDAEQIMIQTGDIAQPNLSEYRYTCANCQNIFKFDLLMQYWKAQKRPKLPKGKGKRCTIPDSIQHKIVEHHSKGMSQQKIADLVGVSRQQVQRVIARLRA